MDSATTLARHYLAAWNERNAPERRAQVARLFTIDASYVDPMMAGAPDTHHDVLRFSWTLHAPDGAQVVRGTDVARIGDDGRLASVTGFLDGAI